MIRSLRGVHRSKEKKAVVLQGGGLDSCVITAILDFYGYEVIGLYINYGQQAHEIEEKCAEEVCRHYGIYLEKAEINLPWINGIPLISGQVGEFTITDALTDDVDMRSFIPMRNHLFISVASGLAEKLGHYRIGVGLDGYQNFLGNPLGKNRDAHPNFIKKIERSIREGSNIYREKRLEIIAPFVGNYKYDTVKLGIDFNAPMQWSWSCYNTGERPCGQCEHCQSRASAFRRFDTKDPLLMRLDAEKAGFKLLVKD